MRILLALAVGLVLATTPVSAKSVLTPREGWRIETTQKDYATLLEDLKAAVKANEMGIVTEAGPTEMAAKRGEQIPGNRVVGVFRNDFAVAIIRVAPAAMIEPPVRFMVYEEADGTGTLAYKLPSNVFAPYADEGGEELAQVVESLDQIFAAIADQAIR